MGKWVSPNELVAAAENYFGHDIETHEDAWDVFNFIAYHVESSFELITAACILIREMYPEKFERFEVSDDQIRCIVQWQFTNRQLMLLNGEPGAYN